MIEPHKAPKPTGAELVLQLEEQSVQFSAVTLDVGLNQSRTIELVEGGSFVISCFSEARGFQQSQVSPFVAMEKVYLGSRRRGGGVHCTHTVTF